jgi:DNA-directed RNA polymerase specialized sigma subunit
MKEYIYKFADGTKSVVAVEDKLFEVLKGLDQAEKYGNRKETRRHVSLDELWDNGMNVPVFDEHTFGELFANLPNEELFEAVKNLAVEQKELLKKVFYERKRLKEIASEQKVTPQLISLRLRITLEQLGTKR